MKNAALTGRKVGIIASYSNTARVAQDDTTEQLAGTLVAMGAQILFVPWTEIARDDGNVLALDHSRRSVTQLGNLERALDLLLLRDLGKLGGREDEFTTFLSVLQGLSIPVVNSVPCLVRNSNKRYLVTLAEAGFPVPPTTLVHAIEELDRWVNGPGRACSDVVLKPLEFGELGDGVVRLSRLTNAETHDLFAERISYLAQAYMSEISAGEKRLVFVGGQFSHAVLKPISDGFKASDGKDILEYVPTEAELTLSQRILEFFPERIDIARIDLAGSGDRVQIVELELINPNLHEDRIANPGKFFEHIGRHLADSFFTRTDSNLLHQHSVPNTKDYR